MVAMRVIHVLRSRRTFLSKRGIARNQSARMRIISVINQKGGSCKTATTVNLAAALGELGLRVLVVDLDPQASATRWLGLPDDTRELFEAFTNDSGVSSLVRETSAPKVQAVCSSIWLAQLERQLAGEPGAEMILRKALRTLPQTSWDIVLLDSPPALGFLSVSALTAAHEILVPLESAEALDGLKDLLKTIGRVRERLNPELAAPRVLLSRVEPNTRLWRELAQGLRERLGDAVLRAVVHDNIRVREAYANRTPVTAFAPSSIAAKDFLKVARELTETSKTNTVTKKSARKKTS